MCLLVCGCYQPETAYELRISAWSSDVCSAALERDGFFQAARLLFRTHGLTDLRAGGREAVRFGVIDSLSFPPGEITALQPAPEQVDAELRMTVAFPGLTGPRGVLPHHYTRWLTARARAPAHGPADFLDLFTTRLLLLSWRPWRNPRPAIPTQFA